MNVGRAFAGGAEKVGRKEVEAALAGTVMKRACTPKRVGDSAGMKVAENVVVES